MKRLVWAWLAVAVLSAHSTDQAWAAGKGNKVLGQVIEISYTNSQAVDCPGGAPTYRIYEEGTDGPIATGTMDTRDNANTAGFYTKSITLTSTPYDEGKSYIAKMLCDDATDLQAEDTWDIIPATVVASSLTGDVGGKVLGGGAGTITGVGVRAVDGSGNAIAPAATALSTATWTSSHAAAILPLATGTADSGTATTMVDAALTQADTDYWRYACLKITSGNLAGQMRQITGFTPASDTVTVSPAFTQAIATHTYDIMGTAACTSSGDVNVVSLGGSTQSLTDLKDLADDGYDPATNKLQGLVLADTTTTLTNHGDSAGVTTLLTRIPSALTLTGGNVHAIVQAYAASQDPATYVLATPANKLFTNASGRIDLGLWLGLAPNALTAGRVDSIVGAYAASQDPATYVLATPANRLVTDATGRIQVQIGTAAGQLATAGGRVNADIVYVGGTAIPASTVGGVLRVDLDLIEGANAAAQNLLARYNCSGYAGDWICVTINTGNTDTWDTIAISETGVITASGEFRGWRMVCGKESREIVNTANGTPDTITIEPGNPFSVAPVAGTVCHLRTSY